MAKTLKSNALDEKQRELDKELEKYRSKIKELEAERDTVAEELRDLKVSANLERLKELAKHKDTILNLMKHSRTSCSDEDPCNGLYCNYDGDCSYRCTKCAVMEILECPEGYREYCIDFDAYISVL